MRNSAMERETTVEENAVMSRKNANELNLASPRKAHRSTTVRRTIFVVLIALICLSPLGYYCLNRLNPDAFPTTSYLAGGDRKSYDVSATTEQIIADPIGAILNGTLEEKIEVQIEQKLEDTYITKSIPFKDELYLVSAAGQRLGICTANLVWHYDAMPTFFASEYVFMPRKQVVFSQPGSDDSDSVSGFAETIDEFSRLAKNNPNSRWFFYLEDFYSTTSCNPVVALMSNARTYESYLNELEAAVSMDATVISGAYTDFEEFLADHYATDHHWNIHGALKGFGRIAEAMQIEIPEWSGPVYASKDEFYGTAARSGLILDYYDDGIEDVLFDMSKTDITIDGKPVEAADVNLLCGDQNRLYEKQHETEYIYDTCFHEAYAEVSYINENVKEKTLVIVGNSYARVIERLFTASYHTVVVYDPRYDTTKRTIQDVLDAYSPDDVLFMWNCGGMKLI